MSTADATTIIAQKFFLSSRACERGSRGRPLASQGEPASPCFRTSKPRAREGFSWDENIAGRTWTVEGCGGRVLRREGRASAWGNRRGSRHQPLERP